MDLELATIPTEGENDHAADTSVSRATGERGSVGGGGEEDVVEKALASATGNPAVTYSSEALRTSAAGRPVASAGEVGDRKNIGRRATTQHRLVIFPAVPIPM